MSDRIADDFVAAWRAYRARPSHTSERAAQDAEWLLYKRDGGDAVIAAKERVDRLAGTP